MYVCIYHTYIITVNKMLAYLALLIYMLNYYLEIFNIFEEYLTNCVKFAKIFQQILPCMALQM